MTLAHFGLTMLVAVLSGQAAPGAQAPAPPPTQAPGSLQGTAWRAVELAGVKVAPQAAAREPHLIFGNAGQLSGADGCNRLTGRYTTAGNNGIAFGEMAGTQMFCEGAAEIVRRFRMALAGTSRWSLAAGRLEFYGATGKPLAVFERREPSRSAAASSLDGTSWQLVKFQGGDGRTVAPDDRARYTIQFERDGGVAARIDCNRGRGTWKATAAGQLELGPLALTRALCPPGSLHDQIVRQWGSIRSFVIRDGHLFLSLMADAGIYEFEPLTLKK